ncbi:MAG TPA: DNA primase [Gemmatimonadaceae bacterium]|nr:DNA primase [Gemmatimonadaceae bacterium]
MIPDEVVEQVREAADVVQIIGEYVKLKKTGADYRGPCPFHQGTHKNFSVSPRKGIFYCFVCHEGGDVFRFVQKRLGVGWPEAVRIVGQKAGVEVKEVDTRREGPDAREPFWEINAAAAEYFKTMLWDDPRGKGAREYLESREISRELAQEIGIGYAPPEIGLMRTYLSTLGYDDARMLETGLLVQREEGTEPRPRFRDRLMFPILDVMGRHVGFGGRVLGSGEPKYLNSPDSPVFSKGKLLYALNWAKNEIRREDRVLVVEGYFDVVRLIAAGVRSGVAPMGTALTDAQANLIRKYTKNAVLLYDNDRGGLAATFRSGDELLRQGFGVRVVTLPEGDDPDTFVRREGAVGLEREITAAIDVFERKVQILQRVGAFSELHKKRRALDRLLPTIRAASDPIMRDLYLARASEASGVDRAILQREVDAPARRGERAPAPARPADSEADIGQTVAVSPQRGEQHLSYSEAGGSAERELIRAMLEQRTRVAEIAEKVGLESFRDRRYRRIFARLLASDENTTVQQLAEGLHDTDVAVIDELLSEPGAQIDPQRTVNDSLTAIRVRELDEKLMEIDATLPLAGAEQKDELMKLKQELRDELNSLRRTRYKAFRVRRKTAPERE